MCWNPSCKRTVSQILSPLQQGVMTFFIGYGIWIVFLRIIFPSVSWALKAQDLGKTCSWCKTQLLKGLWERSQVSTVMDGNILYNYDDVRSIMTLGSYDFCCVLEMPRPHLFDFKRSFKLIQVDLFVFSRDALELLGHPLEPARVFVQTHDGIWGNTQTKKKPHLTHGCPGRRALFCQKKRQSFLR